MLVLDYLRAHSLSQLEADHGVLARVVGHKISLNYSMIDARDSDPISQECRGLVITPVGSVVQKNDDPIITKDVVVGDCRVLARTMRRFFNYGQEAAAPVDFEHPDTRIYEKLDGTLCILYFDDVKGEWCVATRSMPEANVEIDGFSGFDFTKLFWKSMEDTAGSVSIVKETLDKSLTYCFELTTPMNQIVVRYEDFRVTMLAVLSRDGKEFHPDAWAAKLGVDVPLTYRLSSVTEMMDFVSGRDPKGYEGVVVCDHAFNRVKIKSAGYLAFNKIRDNVLKSPRALLEVILLEKLDDVSVVLNEYQKAAAYRMLDAYRDLCVKVNNDFTDVMGEVAEANEKAGWAMEMGEREHRKLFALRTQARGAWIGPMMWMYVSLVNDRRSSPRFQDWIAAQKDQQHGWSNTFLDNIISMMDLDLKATAVPSTV